MKLSAVITVLFAVIVLSSCAEALKTYSGDVVSIDSPVEDDIFAAGNTVYINAPVDSAVIAGGTLNINAPVKGDVFAAGGQVFVNSAVGGKVVAAGGNVHFGGNIGSNLVAGGGNVNILPGVVIGRDALLVAGNVVNAGKINGIMTVSANNFQNTGNAGKVDFRRMETSREEQREKAREMFSFFGILMILGYFILGLVLLRYMPGLFIAVDNEIRSSPILRTVIGFILIIASFIAILIVAITVIGIPIAIIGAMLLAVALMLTGTFVSFSLGKWIGDRLKLKYGHIALFVIGFVILNMLFLLPFLGWLIGLISMSLGFGAILYAARNSLPGKTMASSA